MHQNTRQYQAVETGRKMTAENGKIAAIDVGGPDALGFLQGQLTQDLETVRSDAPSYAAWVNPAGRVITIADVVRTNNGFRLYVPASLRELIVERLRKFRMRSSVELEIPDGPFFEATVAKDKNDHAESSTIARRRLESDPPLLERFATSGPLAARTAAGRRTVAEWQRARLQAGIPWIGKATTERFTAQQINLDLIGAISFTKGCYSGQEIIARTHNLGRVKRRARRLTAAIGDSTVLCGDDIVCDGKKTGTVIAASGPDSGPGLDILALLPVVGLPDEFTLPGGLPLTLAPLPYEIPDP